MTRHTLKRLKNLILFIKKYSAEFGFQPTYREIAEEFEVTIGTISIYLSLLESLGYVKKVGNRATTIIKEFTDV